MFFVGTLNRLTLGTMPRIGNVCILLPFFFIAAVSHRHFDFIVKETNFTRLCNRKSILTVNGSFPGPVIRVQRTEIIYITVHNKGPYGLTIHWHGLKQPGNPWSDGPENITQCKIQPAKSFTYEVVVSTEEGTLWWHAHSDWSRATVHGAFVIYPKPGSTFPFPIPSAEQTIILASWFKGDVMAIIDEALQTGGEPNSSDAFTINGQPGDLYPCSASSTFRLLVDYGKSYLLRIVNAVMNEEMFFSIANHNMTVVGMDGSYVKPIESSYIMITPGQTTDVLIKANHETWGRHYMAATAYSSGIAPIDNSTTTAILEYSTSCDDLLSSPFFPVLPAKNDTNAATLFTNRIRSLPGPRRQRILSRRLERRIIITVSINQFICPNSSCAGPNGNRLAASLNNQSFNTPSIDVLQAYYRGIRGVYKATFPDLPPNPFNYTAVDTGNNTVVPTLATKVKLLKYDEMVEIVFQGTNVTGSAMNHPMHLHGFSYYQVGSGFGNFDVKKDPKSYNLIDPPELNTVGVPRNGWLAVRFAADNPGVWFMHCHLDRHSSWGMDTVLIVRNGKTCETSMRPPPPYMPRC